jgi:hypothetical protein
MVEGVLRRDGQIVETTQSRMDSLAILASTTLRFEL